MSSETAEPMVATHPYWTVAMVRQMPRVEGERYELIDGELYVTTQPHTRHQIACSKIMFQLELWNSIDRPGVIILAPGVIYSPREAVAPDVVWVSSARLKEIMGKDGKLHGSPELMIELLSPGKANAERDREKKLALYSRRAVQEYWIADWQTNTVELYRRQDGPLALVQIMQAGETLTSPLLPGFQCVIDRFFEL